MVTMYAINNNNVIQCSKIFEWKFFVYTDFPLMGKSSSDESFQASTFQI